MARAQDIEDQELAVESLTPYLAPIPVSLLLDEVKSSPVSVEPKPFNISDYIKQATDFLNSPENLRLAEGAAQMQQVSLPDGRSINVYADGLAQEFTPDGRVKVYNQAGETILNQTVEEYARPGYLQPVTNAVMAAMIGYVLGPYGAGLLGTPAAAAAGAGASTLALGGSSEDALKAAALSGLAAYGQEYLLASSETLAAKDLAASGMSEEQIVDTLISQGVSPNTAIEAASNATSGSAAGSARGLEYAPAESAPVGGITESTALPGGVTEAAAPALAASPGLLATQPEVKDQPVAETTTPSDGGLLTEPTQTTTIEGQAATANVPIVPAVVTAPLQTTTVTGQTAAQEQPPAAPMLGATIATPESQTVEIVERSTPAQTSAPIIPIVSSGSVSVPGKGEVPVETALIPEGKVSPPASNQISLTDAATAAMLLGQLTSLLDQESASGYQMDPNLAAAIINAPKPVYGLVSGQYQAPQMFQIAPTSVYNPFATTAPFGAGRFGGFSAPITLPGGLI